jgi:hypothetical protein
MKKIVIATATDTNTVVVVISESVRFEILCRGIVRGEKTRSTYQVLERIKRPLPSDVVAAEHTIHYAILR